MLDKEVTHQFNVVATHREGEEIKGSGKSIKGCCNLIYNVSFLIQYV